MILKCTTLLHCKTNKKSNSLQTSNVIYLQTQTHIRTHPVVHLRYMTRMSRHCGSAIILHLLWVVNSTTLSFFPSSCFQPFPLSFSHQPFFHIATNLYFLFSLSPFLISLAQVFLHIPLKIHRDSSTNIFTPLGSTSGHSCDM